MLIPNTDAKWW